MVRSRLFLLAALAACALEPAVARQTQDPAPITRPRNVAIVVYPSVELLDFAGPGEVFASAHTGGARGIHVYTVAESSAPVTSMEFVTITPEFTLDNCPTPDIVVVPGGNVPLQSAKLKSWITKCDKTAELMMSVCNGALLYASTGLLKDLEVTTHHSALQSLALIEPTAKVYANRRFVDNGHVLTSAGISAGIDGALQVLTRLYGEETAWETARYMEYDWRPDEIAKLHAQPGRGLDDAEAMRWVASIRRVGLDAARAEYAQLPKPPSETQMNRWGYELVRSNKVDEGIDVFRLVAAVFPTSANASDSLSEAYEAKGNTKEAVTAAKDCLARLAKETTLEPARAQLLRNASGSRIARLNGAKASELPYRCPPCANTCDKLSYMEAGRCPNCSMELVRAGDGDAQN
jgi:putative intracellular protease/amidase